MENQLNKREIFSRIFQMEAILQKNSFPETRQIRFFHVFEV